MHNGGFDNERTSNMKELQTQSILSKGTNGAAVLLLHGFSGTPYYVWPLARFLNGLGFTVSVPLLAGHGQTREELATTRWPDWYQTAQEHFLELRETHHKVFVAGHSLGGLLALHLAHDYQNEISAIAVLAAPLFLKKWMHLLLPIVSRAPVKYFFRYAKRNELNIKDRSVLKKLWDIGYMPVCGVQSLTELQDRLKQELAKILLPTLLIYAKGDSIAPYTNMAAIQKKIGSPVVKTITLDNSYHMITWDYEKEVVNQKVGEFFQGGLKDERMESE